MTLFWFLAAAITLVVLAVLLRPLIKARAPLADNTAASNLRILRTQLAELESEQAAGTLDAEQYAAARAELEQRALDESAMTTVAARVPASRRSAFALALAVPVVAVALYLQLGSREAFDPLVVAASEKGAHSAAPGDMEAAVQRLADKLKAQPDSVEGWALLGRSYMQMQRFDQARDAYARAVALQGDDAQLLADYADALAMAQGRNLEGEPEKIVLRALTLDPDHVKSLALAGTAAMARKDYASAVRYWTRARAVVPEDNPLAQGLDAGIAEAKAAGGLSATAGSATAATPAPKTAAAAPARALRVSVSLAPALASKVQPGDTLIVFARPAEGSRMPLAIVRQPADGKPVTVQLDDSSAMSPQSKLSSVERVVVVARVSRQGGAMAASGDLEGESAPREPQGELQLVIDRVRP
jgi:cytochrome c-type biogenesis protein CcmH